jgi:hypothetical protein
MTQQYSITRSTLLAALTIASMAATSTEAFQLQPPVMVASIGSSSKLNYVVDRATGTSTTSAGSIGIEKRKTTKKKASTTITTNKTVVTGNSDSDSDGEKDTDTDNHGYIVANHDNERSFWLHALQNLEPSPQSPSNKQSLWTKIACAYGPRQLREACATIEQNNDALLVRVGDTDLDIALAVSADFWDVTLHMNENVVSTTTGSRKNRQIVTIRVGFPEGSSFDKDAFTFEDELTAVIGQVRLLEQHANEKLSCSKERV